MIDGYSMHIENKFIMVVVSSLIITIFYSLF